MKLLAALALVLATPFARAEAAVEPSLVSTSGTAEISVVPNLADLQFEVEVRNADLAAARKEQATRTAKVIAALRAAGIAEADLQAADISISPNYTENQRDRVETAKVRFFSVTQRIAVTARDVKKVPDVIASAFNAGATEMGGVILRTSEIRKYRDEARAKAIRLAKEKATALAAELGAKIGKPFRIIEGTPFSLSSSNGGFEPPQIPQTFGNAPADAGDNPAPAFAPGTISVTATVSVSFWLE